jgi:hypothetical protein
MAGEKSLVFNACSYANYAHTPGRVIISGFTSRSKSLPIR